MIDRDQGGGASRSTEPAAGTSTATDVSLYAHLAGMIHAERVLTDQQFASQARMAEALREGDIEAVKIAFSANESLTKAHNGLLRKMELQGETFATREAMDRRLGTVNDIIEKARITDEARFTRIEHWQAKLGGGILVLAFIGIANLVKVWT